MKKHNSIRRMPAWFRYGVTYLIVGGGVLIVFGMFLTSVGITRDGALTLGVGFTALAAGIGLRFARY